MFEHDGASNHQTERTGPMAAKSIIKSEAKARGLLHYFTSKPCKWGHTANRLVSNGQCVDCQREAAREYLSVPENRDRHNARTRRYSKSQRGAETRIQQQVRKRVAIAGRPKPDKCELCVQGGIIHFDHCHLTGKFRGWLCAPCNQVIGLAKDNPQLLRKLADYIEHHNRLSPQGDWICAEETRQVLKKDSTWQGICPPQK